jgi:NADPH:quinone reductase-like Zn-dependent oxidoreductase
MKAIVNATYGSPDVLEYKDIEKPIPKDNEVLIKIHAAGLNAADWHILRAKPFLVRIEFGFRTPKHKILGADIAGVIEAVGKDVTQFKVGDEIFGDLSSNSFGGFAEYVAVVPDKLVLKPKNLTFQEAAVVPLSAVSALQALRKGKIQEGKKVIIVGASGGVGTFAVQIAKALGAEVTAVCSSKNVELAKSLGADFVIDYSKEDFTKGEKKYDLILGANGNNSIFAYKRALAPKGIYITSGGSNKQLVQGIFLGGILSMFGDRKLTNLLAKPNKEDLEFVKKLIEEGKVRPVIDRTYKLSEVADGIRYLEEGHAKGKVVVEVVG